MNNEVRFQIDAVSAAYMIAFAQHLMASSKRFSAGALGAVFNESLLAFEQQGVAAFGAQELQAIIDQGSEEDSCQSRTLTLHRRDIVRLWYFAGMMEARIPEVFPDAKVDETILALRRTRNKVGATIKNKDVATMIIERHIGDAVAIFGASEAEG